jgi:hypothetical protein
MEIFDLIEEKYNAQEYSEILKLFYIKKNNAILIENLYKILTATTDAINTLKININDNDMNIITLNDKFYENNKMFKHILENML